MRVRRPSAHALRRSTAAALLPLLAAAVWLSLTSDHLRWPVATAVYRSYMVAAPVLIGLLWWRRRPDSRFGPLLVAFGLIAFPMAWTGSGWAPLFSLGVLADAPFIVLNFYLLLAFPVGRLETATDKLLMGSFAAVFAVFFMAWILLTPDIAGGGPLAACVEAPCPDNALMLVPAPDVGALAGEIEIYAGVTITFGVIATYVARVLTASRPRRRALLAVAATSLLLLPPFAAFHLLRTLGADKAITEALSWAVVGARVIYPLGFLFALLQAERFATRALRDLLAGLAERPGREGWRRAVARALDDPSARVDYGVPPAEPGRIHVPVARGGEAPVAVISADEVLAEDPELLAATAKATLIAVENGHLERELRASQARVMEAGDAERRRIARDLHDSAQQRLVALRMRLGDEPALTPDLDAALEDLRTVAAGLYPPLLGEYGVAAALQPIARAAVIDVTIEDGSLGRHPEAVESALYFCCLEALQNASKHAGPEATATVRLGADAATVRFEVEDDGAGFNAARRGSGTGLRNIADRVSALGGTLEVDAAAGRGTRIAGRIPVGDESHPR